MRDLALDITKHTFCIVCGSPNRFEQVLVLGKAHWLCSPKCERKLNREIIQKKAKALLK